ncbi:MAG: hypothetical protein JNL01_02800 [Bdellovibrionales bacterium]|nr:hypothetical protein [Bdellovibrionales bacterium]
MSKSNTENESRELRRGIDPKTLLEGVRNTIPYFFDETTQVTWPGFSDFLKNHPQDLSHSQYFRLCLTAHWVTVGSMVPTDVDMQIRVKLWNPSLTPEAGGELDRMLDLVLEAKTWDWGPFCHRQVVSPESGKRLGGHEGEWFSIAAGAYCAIKKKNPKRAHEISQAIQDETRRHAEIYQDLKKARDGIGLLKAATLIAHNLGDLDRVIDLWGLDESDSLRAAVFELGHPPRQSGEGPSLKKIHEVLFEAGELNKHAMAAENHRHFALRKPRALRTSPDFLLEVAPFWDPWGERLAKHPGISQEGLAEIVEALIEGHERLPKSPMTFAYPRALRSIFETYPGGEAALIEHVGNRARAYLKQGPLRQAMQVSYESFMKRWDEIPWKFFKTKGQSSRSRKILSQF